MAEKEAHHETLRKFSVISGAESSACRRATAAANVIKRAVLILSINAPVPVTGSCSAHMVMMTPMSLRLARRLPRNPRRKRDMLVANDRSVTDRLSAILAEGRAHTKTILFIKTIDEDYQLE